MTAPAKSTVRSRRVAAVASVVATAALGAVLLWPGGGGGREVTVLAPSATWMLPGLQVRVGGVVVGHVTSAQPTRAGTARVGLQIDDPRAWPLPVGTRARFRWAGTIAFTNRYVELDPPPRNGRWIANGGVIAGQDVVETVEFNQIFDVFGAGTRSDLKSLLDEGGPALTAARQGLQDTLAVAPSALQQAQAALQQLGSDPGALDTLVTSTGAVVHAAQSADPGVSQLVSGAATTLSATAQQAGALGRTLAEMPRALDTVRGTLAHANGTLLSANHVLVSLSPGVVQVSRLAAPLNSLLGTVVAVGPDAYSTLVSVRRAVPDLNPLLDHARGLMPQLQSIGRQGTTELACIRPYAPEAAGLASTWTSFLQYSDKKDKYARVNGGVYPYASSETPVTSAQVVKLLPTMKYVFPAPPGAVAGQPWFIPSCGVGADSLNAAKDPETP